MINVIKNSFLVLGDFSGKIIFLLTQILLLDILDEYGHFAIGWTLLRVNTLIGTFGLDKTVLYFGNKFDLIKQNKLITLTLLISFFISLFISLTTYPMKLLFTFLINLTLHI